MEGAPQDWVDVFTTLDSYPSVAMTLLNWWCYQYMCAVCILGICLECLLVLWSPFYFNHVCWNSLKDFTDIYLLYDYRCCMFSIFADTTCCVTNYRYGCLYDVLLITVWSWLMFKLIWIFSKCIHMGILPA